MHNKSYKKAIVFALVLTMLMPLGSMAASTTDDEVENNEVSANETADTDANEEKSEDDDDKVEPITDEEAIKLETCQEVASNDNFILYSDEENERLGLFVKSSGKYWWTSPVNVMADQTITDESKGSTMKKTKRKQISSSVAIKIADLESRASSPAPIYSSRSRQTWKNEANGVAVTYKYSSEGVAITVHYELCDDNLYVYADTSEIVEDDTSALKGKILTKLQLCPSFGAIGSIDSEGNATEGYMIVPDGSGAVINYNNGKTNYPEYSQIVYGRDYTTVSLTAPRVTEQAYLPVLATVSGNSGLVAVASDGDSNVYANAKVSGQDGQPYNTCYFEFETRGSDSFFMSGDNANKITVFEKGDIKTSRFGVRYFPIDKTEDVNYADCAEVYRNYLVNSKGLTSKVNEENSSALNLSLYGGVLKQTSILGLPFDLKTEITGFEQASEIVSKFKEKGVDDVLINYNDWTNEAIKNKISTNAKASGTLGGSSDFESLLSTENTTIFPSLNNIQMDSSSWGYLTFTNTAIRISNSYSRQSQYNIAFGLPEKGVAPALLSPSSYNKVFEQMTESYNKNDLKTVGFGDFSTKLVSDFSTKNNSSREKTMQTIVDGYSNASESIGSILCEGANAYVLPFASQITEVPVYSSNYNLIDYDVPFYQMVIHGYIPYSTKAINASSNTGETFMLALAAGSSLNYDMVYESAFELKDTDYDNLYYSNYEGWLDMASQQYSIANEMLSGVGDMTISKYERSEDGNILTTTYSKDGKSVAVEVNMTAGTATVDGKVYDLGNAIEGGVED